MRIIALSTLKTFWETNPKFMDAKEPLLAWYRHTLKAGWSSPNDVKANTLEGETLDVLVTLVEAYERKHYPLDLPDAVEAIKFEMDQRGLTVKDLEPVIGRPNRVYEVLSYRRPLTLPMIQRLHSRLGIPAES